MQLLECTSQNEISLSGCWSKIIAERGVCFEQNIEESISDFGTDNSILLGYEFNEHYPQHSDDALPNYLVTIGKKGQRGDDRYNVNYYIPWPSLSTRDKSPKDVVHYEITSIKDSTSDFANLYPVQRQCYFADEKPLRFSSKYLQANCLLECSWQGAMEACGCIPWFLRQLYGEEKTEICHQLNNQCFMNFVEARFKNKKCLDECLDDCYHVGFTMKSKSRHDNIYLNGDEKDFPAECINLYESKPICLYMSHKQKISAMNEFNISLDHEYLNSRSVKSQLGLIEFYGANRTTLKTNYDSSYTILDAISNIGGIGGVFLGFSLLSLIELIYWIAYFTVKFN